MPGHKAYLRAALLLAVLGGCAVGPDFEAPQAPQTSSYTATPLPAQTVTVSGKEEKTQKITWDAPISRQWWTVFRSKNLSALIDQALRNSPTLHAAQYALQKAKENLNAEVGGFFPSLDAQGSATRQKTSRAAFGVNTPSPPFNLYNASLNVSYSPDIFGALRRQVEALEAEVDYQKFELEAAYLTMTTTLVTTAIQEASVRAQIQATQELLLSQEKQMDIIRSQFRLGSVSQADILAQETLVAQTRATLPPLMSSRAQTRHALAALAGELPSEAAIPSFTFSDIHLPTDLPVALPASLVQNRPDIKAAEALLHAASAQIGVAKAAMFPQLMLTGNIGDTSGKFHSLFASSSSVWGIGSQLLLPFFRGGAMLAKEDAAQAGYDQAFAQYRQTVLQAFQQVADVLQALVEGAKTHKALEEAEKAAHRALQMTQKQYRLGAVSFLEVLTAERQYQQTHINRIQAEAARYATTATLFQALGGDCFIYRQSLPESVHQENPPTGCTMEAES